VIAKTGGSCYHYGTEISKGGINMDVTSLAMPDIASLSMVMAQDKVMSDFGTAMLSKSLDTFEQNGAEMAKMLELSVNPGVGGNFDMSV